MKLVKTVVQVVVLSEGDVDFDDLSELHDLITIGGCSGNWAVTATIDLTREEMAASLEEQGSDPDFFGPWQEQED
jgi:hypothetical protein